MAAPKPFPFTQEEFKGRYHYDPASGFFTRVNGHYRWPRGSRAGCKKPNGYRCIKIDGKAYTEHRLAFLWMTGAAPDEVDHINRVKDDNRWENLRPCTRSENMKNRAVQGRIPIRYIGYNRVRKLFQAGIKNELPRKYFKTLERAVNYISNYQKQTAVQSLRAWEGEGKRREGGA